MLCLGKGARRLTRLAAAGVARVSPQVLLSSPHRMVAVRSKREGIGHEFRKRHVLSVAQILLSVKSGHTVQMFYSYS